ncbi:TPA: hypothetical protein NU643_001436 [Acinetobacter baumannii]|uniref:hypothetical protein n=1 Tax=Acinetobacter baumannii TaxID=470 RepID=UPI00112A389F|nr:hypothetical protein [Acinetobacter baumannii]TPU13147.1 hypothetical protein FJU86_18385 [Acinetobacter baumannii]HCJ6408844.1 hypothetical protein [Acinetobacter baumannii]
MRKIVLLGLVFLPFLGNASPFPKQAEEEKSEKFCRGWMDIAESIMAEKQKGTSLSIMLKSSDSMKTKEDERLIRTIIRDAYSQPSYSTPSIKKEQLNEFAARYYLNCIDVVQKSSS